MGSWGTGIFSDDLAADVRADWRDGIIAREDPAELTERLVGRYRPGGGDANDAIVFWLALAATQQETGRLDATVRDHVLALIDAGGDVARWRAEDEALARRRAKVLARLAERLRGPQPVPKRIRRAPPKGVEFAVGDVVQLLGRAGQAGVFAIVVTHLDTRHQGTHPVVELVLWEEARLPTRAELADLPCVVSDIGTRRSDGSSRPRPLMFVVTTTRKSDSFDESCGRVVAHGVVRPPAGDPSNGAALGGEVLTHWTTWRGLTLLIGWESFRRDAELTRALPSRAGTGDRPSGA